MANLQQEVKAVLGEKVDSDGNKLCDLWLKKDLPQEQWPRIDGCADVGWQWKGSGCRCSSESGHAFIIGMSTCLIIVKALCSKACGFCKSWFTKHTVDEVVPDHECFINHDGSSGSVEPKAVLEMHCWLFEQQVIIQ